MIGVGVALGGTVVPALRAIRGDLAALSRDVGDLRKRMARLEGLIEGWRGEAPEVRRGEASS